MDYYYSGTTNSTMAASLGTSTLNNTVGQVSAILGSLSIVILICLILQIAAWWKIFVKAGEKGWKSIVPIYNYVVLFRISGVSPWLLLSAFACVIPVVGFLAFACVWIYQTYKFAKSFGKGIGTTVLLLIEPFATIEYLILGFGSTEYVGPGGNEE